MFAIESGIAGFLFVQGLLLTVLFVRKKPVFPHIMIGCLSLYYSFLMLNLLLSMNPGGREIPLLDFLTGAFIYMYISGKISRGLPSGPDWLVFLPFLFNFIYIPAVAFLEPCWTIILCFAAIVRLRGWKKAGGDPLLFLMPSLAAISALVDILDRGFLITGYQNASDFFSGIMLLLEACFIFIPAWFLLYRNAFDITPASGLPDDRAREKYGKNLLDDSLLEDYYGRLKNGMETEAWFRNPGLSLALLSEFSAIPAVSLSQVINRKEGMNFNSYLSRLRVEEACRILKQKDDRTILEVMYSVGFNSKSVFNTAFKRGTGMTPKEYRGA